MSMIDPPRRILAALVFAVSLSTGADAKWMADEIPDGPAAADIRAAFTALEEGEGATDETEKLAAYERGLVHAKRAVAIDEKNPDAHFAVFGNWGRILQSEGLVRNAFQLPKLLRYLDRTLELKPDHADALASRAGLYLELPGFLGGDPDKGEPMLRRALQIDPLMAGGRLELAEHCYETDREEEAKQLALSALEISRGNGKKWHETRALRLLDEMGVPPPMPAVSATKP